MKRFLVALAVLALALNAGEPKDPVLKEHFNATYRIVIFQSIVSGDNVMLEQRGSGSGTAIDEKHILTAKHVGEHANEPGTVLKAEQVGLDGTVIRSFPVKKAKLHPDTDLAILETIDELPFHVKLKYGEIDVGDEIVCVGFPIGIGKIVAKGTFSGVEGAAGYSRRGTIERGQVSHVPGGPGNSGSLVRDTKGNVAGVLVAGHTDAPLVVLIPADIVKEFTK